MAASVRACTRASTSVDKDAIAVNPLGLPLRIRSCCSNLVVRTEMARFYLERAKRNCDDRVENRQASTILAEVSSPLNVSLTEELINRIGEGFDDCFIPRFAVVALQQDQEIVAADMANEIFRWIAIFFQYFCDALNHLITLAITE